MLSLSFPSLSTLGVNGLSSSPGEYKRSETVLLSGAKLANDELSGDNGSVVICGKHSL